MKEKIIKILLLFLIFLISVLVVHNYKKPIECKVLSVVEADEFYLDINNNGFIDKNEHVKLSGVQAYYPIKTHDSLKVSKKLGISEEHFLKVGLLARVWASENLKYKNVLVYGLNDCQNSEICNVKIEFQNQDLAKFLLKNGLAYSLDKVESSEYFQFLNIEETKNIANKLSELNFLLLNLRTNVLHMLDCENVNKISKGELILKNKISDSQIFCKKCLEQKIKADKISFSIPKSKKIYKKSFSWHSDDLDVYFINPLQYSKPNTSCTTDFCKRLISEISLAKNSIDVALYGFGEQKEVFQALVNAKNRGVIVRAITDCDDEQNENDYYPLTKTFINEFDAVCDKRYTLMHNKFFIFDDKKVVSGSANISSTGSGGYNSNIALAINNSKVAKIYKSEFEQMYNSHFSRFKKHICNDFSTSDMAVYFSPKDDVYQNGIEPYIKNAKEKIYVSAFYLTDKDMILELINAKKRGVEVLIILDSTSASSFRQKVKQLRESLIPVAIEDWGGKNHEKTIVIDGKILIVGSCNFSKSGFYKNDENIVVIKNKDVAQKYEDYFLYLINSIDKKYFVSFPRPEGFESKNSCNDGIDNNFDGKIDKDDIGCIAQ